MTEEKRGPGRPPKADGFQMRVMRDYWDADGNRIPSGTVVSLPADEAMEGVESGIFARVK